MTYDHKSGLPLAQDRVEGRNDVQGLVFSGDMRFLQSAELNEIQTIERARSRRISRLVAKDGDRYEGAAIVLLDADEGRFVLTAGRLYIDGDVFPIPQAVLEGVPMEGLAEVGAVVNRTWVTYEDDPTLLGPAPGSLAEGEPGASREVVTLSWALNGPDVDNFVTVYTIQNGTVIDQTPPPALSGVVQVIAGYDFDANGNYIVNGCRVTALGKIGGDQVFSIEEGVANIKGLKRTRQAALRFATPEDWNVEEVAGEPHTYPGGGDPVTIATNFRPIAAIGNVLVTKEVTETVTRGPVGGTSDLLANNSVTEVLEVKQGGTTYTVTTDYLKSGDSIDWSPGGTEPSTGSSYTVKYRYLSAVVPSAVTDTSITVSGGVPGTTVIIGYDFKLPRVDVLGLNSDGFPVYLPGVSARKNPLPPQVPSEILKLAEITNNWITKPEVLNNGTRAVQYEEAWRFYNRVVDLDRLVQIERIQRGIDSREPTAKKGTFADPLTSDELRDAGEVQTAAVGLGTIELAITPTFYETPLAAPVMLDWTEEVVVQQLLATNCMKINPYQNFTPMPAAMSLAPAADFWTVSVTNWASPETIEFNRGVRRDNGPLVVSSDSTRQVDQRAEQAEFLRQIAVDYLIEGFGAGEIITAVTFAGVSVHPGGTIVADGNGEYAGTFTIPPNIPAGTKEMHAQGAGGSYASAAFVGQGIVNTTTLRRVTTIERWSNPPTETVTAIPNGAGSSRVDPLAQTFALPEARQLVGVDVKLCAIGDRSNNLLVEQVTVENGIPTTELMASAFVPMAGAVEGWKTARYSLPVLTTTEREAAFVVKTDDADHALSLARLGDFDQAAQSFVGTQPYVVGVMLSSSNARTWTPHQDDDLTFRLVAAKFGPFTKTVPLGSHVLVNASDLQVRANVELPSSECSVVFEVVRADSSVIRLLPYQVIQFGEYVSETVQLRAVLTGTEKLSPVLFNPVFLVAGEIAASGTYVTRAFKLGSAVKLTAYFKAALPFGSAVSVQYDKADDDWQNLPLITTEALSDPAWVEQKREATGITATEGRLKITITGGPSARPRIGDLGAVVM